MNSEHNSISVPETETLTRTYWDRLWSRFLRHQGMIAPSGKLVQLLLPHVSRGGLVLDVGCGEGRNTIYPGRIGFRAVGLDLSRKAVKLLSNNLFEEEVRGAAILGDARRLPFSSASFHGVLAHNLFDHLDGNGFTDSMEEVWRILRPEGVLLMTLDPLPEGISEKETVRRDDGVCVFVSGSRKGMLIREVPENEIVDLANRGWNQLKDERTPRGSRILLLKKRGQSV
ncbi:MAG: class I SAM-dependent methyltransferase [Candidatus Riflebacteria bacterium]|nr:class I SAM-dependent methyltransferase [Candidatus Riflebacteria bacterium]